MTTIQITPPEYQGVRIVSATEALRILTTP
jgi:hypothetical protein